jgi:uncharacterized membrane protein
VEQMATLLGTVLGNPLRNQRISDRRRHRAPLPRSHPHSTNPTRVCRKLRERPWNPHNDQHGDDLHNRPGVLDHDSCPPASRQPIHTANPRNIPPKPRHPTHARRLHRHFPLRPHSATRRPQHERVHPQLAIGFAYVLVVTCIGFFLAFIQHITKSVFVTQVIRDISRTTFKTLDRMSPRSEEIDTTHQPNAWIKPEGVLETPLILHEGDDRLSDIDYHHLVAVSAHLDITIELDVQVGSFIASGTRIGTIYGNLKNPDETLERIRQGFVLSPQRSMRQDTAFGIRQLVDIAGRALSVGINDPLTAVEVVNALHAILTRVVTRPTPIPYVTDYQGNVRLIYKPQTARDLITLATTEIAGWGATSVIVTRQLRKMLRDLSAIALEEHQQPLRNATETVNALDQTPPIVRASTAIVE